MDILAHGLWSYALFSRTKYKWKAALFGTLPDILSFGPHTLASILTFNFPHGKPALSSIPSYIFTMYNITHSLIPVSLVILAIYFVTRKFYVPFLAWYLHILIDIPSHTTDFFPTPYLWPLKTPFVSGISWGNKYFMLINYSCILLVYMFYVFQVHKKLIKTV